MWGRNVLKESIWKAVLSETKCSFLRLGESALLGLLLGTSYWKFFRFISLLSTLHIPSKILQKVLTHVWILSLTYSFVHVMFCPWFEAGFQAISPLIFQHKGNIHFRGKMHLKTLVLLMYKFCCLVVAFLILLRWLVKCNWQVVCSRQFLPDIQGEIHETACIFCRSVDGSLWNVTLLNSWSQHTTLSPRWLSLIGELTRLLKLSLSPPTQKVRCLVISWIHNL